MRRRLGRWWPALEVGAVVVALGLALYVNNVCGRWATEAGALAPTAPDRLLALLPILDLRPLFTWGFAFFLAAVGAAGWAEPDRRVETAWLFALLVVVRSAFILMTPLHSPAGALWVGGDPLFEALGRHLTFEHDLFFSSHTAMPFLAALAFRRRWVRVGFAALSAVLGATVLFSRLHYTVDVAAAYFITYAVYRAHRATAPFYRRWRLTFTGPSADPSS